jgi:hypothetical protein
MNREPNTNQLRFMEKTAKARTRATELADEAASLDLMTLAREWDYVGKCLEGAIGNQLRVFREPSFLSDENTVMEAGERIEK